jgi:hypothetical protein
MTKTLNALPEDMQRVGREYCATPEMPHLLRLLVIRVRVCCIGSLFTWLAILL